MLMIILSHWCFSVLKGTNYIVSYHCLLQGVFSSFEYLCYIIKHFIIVQIKDLFPFGTFNLASIYERFGLFLVCYLNSVSSCYNLFILLWQIVERKPNETIKRRRHFGSLFRVFSKASNFVVCGPCGYKATWQKAVTPLRS